MQLLPGRGAFLWHFGLGRERERGYLLPFWIVGSENKQSCLFSEWKRISLRLSIRFVLIDQTVSFWVFWECSGEQRLMLGEPVLCHPPQKWGISWGWLRVSRLCVWNAFLYQARTSNFCGNGGGVLDKPFFTSLQNSFSGHPQIDLGFANYFWYSGKPRVTRSWNGCGWFCCFLQSSGEMSVTPTQVFCWVNGRSSTSTRIVWRVRWQCLIVVFFILLIPRIGDFYLLLLFAGHHGEVFPRSWACSLESWILYWCWSVPGKEASYLEVVLYYFVFCIVIFLAVKHIGE